MLWVWGPAIAQALLIFFASSLSDPGPMPAGVTDKTGHFAGYALLAALVLRGLAGASLAGVTAGRGGLALLLSSLYGASDEVHQSFVPGRSPDPADWVADTLGALAAVLVVLLAATALRAARRRAPPR